MDIKTSFISYICNQITNIEVKMVLEIRLSNMFSFRDEVTLDLQAAKIQTKKARELEGNLFSVDGEQMLKSVALFGANASGKSNVIKAIRACVNMVRSSHNYNVDTRFYNRENDLYKFSKRNVHFSPFFRGSSSSLEYHLKGF